MDNNFNDNNNKMQLFYTENYNQERVISDLQKVCSLLTIIAYMKGQYYQDSWCKRGLFSISQNLERKMDRLSNILFGTKDNPGIIFNDTDFNKILEMEESIIDTLFDLANYCLLTIVWFKEKNFFNNNDTTMPTNLYDKYVEKFIDSISNETTIKMFFANDVYYKWFEIFSSTMKEFHNMVEKNDKEKSNENKINILKKFFKS